MTERELDPWERRPHEPMRAYEAFRRYRDAGPQRTLDAVDAGPTLLRRWRSHWGWEARCRSWDAEVHRIADQRRLEQIRTMDSEHQTVGRALITAAVHALEAGPELTPYQAARFLDLGTRLERSALLGKHLLPPAELAPLAVVDPDEGLSPLERIARDLAGTA